MNKLTKLLFLPFFALAPSFVKAEVVKPDSLKKPYSFEQQMVDLKKRKDPFFKFSKQPLEAGVQFSLFKDIGAVASIPMVDIGDLTSLYLDVSLNTPFSNIKPYLNNGLTLRYSNVGIQGGFSYVGGNNGGASLPPNTHYYAPVFYFGLKRYIPNTGVSFSIDKNFTNDSKNPEFTFSVQFSINSK